MPRSPVNLDAELRGMPEQCGDSEAEQVSILHPDDVKLESLCKKLNELASGKNPDTGLEFPETPDPKPKDPDKLLVDSWLRWSQSDGKDARQRWLYLSSRNKLDRDSYVLELWRSVQQEGCKNYLRKWYESHFAPWEYYERHFFGWFLARLDLRAAVAVFAPIPFASLFHLLWALLAVAVSLLGLTAYETFLPRLSFFAGFVALTLLGSVVGKLRRVSLPSYAYFNALVPRLGAAVGIGFLFLASAAHLVQLLATSWRPAHHFWLSTLALTIAPLFYIWFHISRRVFPQPRWRALLERSTRVLVVAIGYSALGLLLAIPVLFSRAFICGNKPLAECAVDVGLHHYALCGAIVLNLAIILQLAWDEKALTEPL
jgi:hypothetical protein